MPRNKPQSLKIGRGCITCRYADLLFLFEYVTQFINIIINKTARKVKWDEAKSICQRCIESQRYCDGYNGHSLGMNQLTPLRGLFVTAPAYCSEIDSSSDMRDTMYLLPTITSNGSYMDPNPHLDTTEFLISRAKELTLYVYNLPSRPQCYLEQCSNMHCKHSAGYPHPQP